MPQADGGSDTPDNAAPLCPSCHETYGANPIKRKFIREARDFWYEVCAKRYASDPSVLASVQSALAGVASKEDIKELRAQVSSLVLSNATRTITLPLTCFGQGSKKYLTIRDLLVLVHTASRERPAFQQDVFCLRELWPVGKDDLRGVYKDFLRRFGERTLRHLACKVLDRKGIAAADHVAEQDLVSALSALHIEAVMLVLLDEGAVRAVLGEDGEIRWTGPASSA